MNTYLIMKKNSIIKPFTVLYNYFINYTLSHSSVAVPTVALNRSNSSNQWKRKQCEQQQTAFSTIHRVHRIVYKTEKQHKPNKKFTMNSLSILVHSSKFPRDTTAPPSLLLKKNKIKKEIKTRKSINRFSVIKVK